MSMPIPASNLATEPSFTPRKEFMRIPLPAPDSFALLALSSANCIRLYSFPASVVDALRQLFERLSTILSSKEDLPQGLYEFALDGKPWANPKAVSTEILLLDILALIYQCGYNYRSTTDYGRESDDRLAMVFSKPGIAPSLSSQTANPPSSSIPANSTSSLNDKERVKRVPFALSFASATLVRVIAPPLHVTPAILQAVRASWPRGIVSEKKVGDNSFEFKLKGYKWFQQDTFATDSLRQILTLLTSLDSHSCSLLTSLSLTNRSRLKDLWIFTGVAPEDSFPEEIVEPNTAVSNIIRLPLQIEATHPNDVPQQHKRFATEPSVHLPSLQHSRANTDGPQDPIIPSPQPHLLRKPAPRAQVPVSVLQDSNIPDDDHHQILREANRAQMPSTISTGIENMTGVGTEGLKSSSSSRGAPPPIVGQVAHGRSGSDKVATLPLLTSTPPKQTTQPNAENEKLLTSTNDLSSPPLLGMDAFRNSALSSNPTTPTTLAGSCKKDAKLEQEPELNSSDSSSGPMFPGGWQSTPLDKKVEEETGFSTSMPEEKRAALIPIHENDSHIEAPAIIAPDLLRKSEAALIEMIVSHAPSNSQDDKPRKESQKSLSSGGQGWVLVNVEGSDAVRSVFGSEAAGPSDATTPRPHELTKPNSPLSISVSAPHTPESPALDQPSPAAKAIVIMDAMESKKKKSTTGLKRFFSLKKNPVSGSES